MNRSALVIGLVNFAASRPAVAGDDASGKPRATLSGRVLDREGKPLAGAEVTVFPSAKRSREDFKSNFMSAFTFAGQEDRAAARVRSGTDGAFVAPNLSIGTYTVRATRPD